MKKIPENRQMDLATGEFIPALAVESHFSKDKHRVTRNSVMQVMTRKRFEYGRRYMAFVTNNLMAENMWSYVKGLIIKSSQILCHIIDPDSDPNPFIIRVKQLDTRQSYV